MIKKYLVLFAFISGVIANFLFWGKLPGISFPIFVAVCLTSGYFLLVSDRHKPSKSSAVLIALVLFLSVMTIIRREPLTLFLNYSLTLFLMALLAMTWGNGSWVSFGMPDYLVNFFIFFRHIFVLPWLMGTEDKQEETGRIKRLFRKSAPVIRGVLITIPVLLLFTALFTSADLVFSNRIEGLVSKLNMENVRELLLRGLLILTVAYIFSGTILFAAKQSGNIPRRSNGKSFNVAFLGLTESSIILSSVLILFGSFVVIQIKYLFLNQADIIIDGFTYAEYARRGFGELVAVAIFSIFLIKGLSLFSKRESARQNTIFSALAAALVSLVLVILVSAFQRLFLYESAYGFTSSRTYAHVFIVWLGILLTALIFMEIFKKQALFANLLLAVIFGFTVSLNFLNPDRFIVRNNIRLAVKNQALDTSYLASLSSDAIPPLAAIFSSQDYSNEIHESIGAAIVCSNENRSTFPDSKVFWQSFNFSEWKADRELQKIRKFLEGYQVDSSEWPTRVISPNGDEFFCQPFYD